MYTCAQGRGCSRSSLGAGVHLVCESLKDLLKDLAIQTVEPFKQLTKDKIGMEGLLLFSLDNKAIAVHATTLVKNKNVSYIESIKTSPGLNTRELQKATNSFSVHFVKVHVHKKTNEIQLQHIVTTGDAGKIISEETARSQMLGGVVGGIGMALTEELKLDHTKGRITNASLGSYLVPRHTMIPPIDVWFTNKPDPYINAIGAKGLGEIAIIGLAGAISNAIFNAIGKRVRDLPITKEKLAKI